MTNEDRTGKQSVLHYDLIRASYPVWAKPFADIEDIDAELGRLEKTKKAARELPLKFDDFKKNIFELYETWFLHPAVERVATYCMHVWDGKNPPIPDIRSFLPHEVFEKAVEMLKDGEPQNAVTAAKKTKILKDLNSQIDELHKRRRVLVEEMGVGWFKFSQGKIESSVLDAFVRNWRQKQQYVVDPVRPTGEHLDTADEDEICAYEVLNIESSRNSKARLKAAE